MRLPGIETATRPVVVDRIIYATIALACILIVYDGWGTLRLLDAVLIILGPVLAMFVSHVFSAGIARNLELHRSVARSEWSRIIRTESRFLLVAVPPIVVLLCLNLAGVSLYDSIMVIIWLEAASIGLWAGLAASRAGAAGMQVAIAVVAGLIVGGLVLLLQAVLQPGKAFDGAVALAGLGRAPHGLG